MPLHVLVLGSAAGGGFPQWNCGCENCASVRGGRPGFTPRSQDSVAVSADGEQWFLLNASPDVLRQIQERSELWPMTLRGSPLLGVALTNGDLDHVLGLFQLRESQPLALYATSRVHAGLNQNVALKTLHRFDGQLRARTLDLGKVYELRSSDDRPSGLFVEAVAVPGKPPLHLETSLADVQPHPEDNVALRIRSATSGTLVYASSVADVERAAHAFRGASALLLDGTFWSENELPDLGVGLGSARTMAHQPIGGEQGSLRALRDLDVPRRIFTHLNNTNPLLDANSKEYATVVSSGWQVALDGLEFLVQ